MNDFDNPKFLTRMDLYSFDVPDLFKYVRMDSALSIISSSSLKFNNPIHFNDIFDCTMYNIYFDMSDLGEHARNDIDLLVKEFPTLKDNMHLMPQGFQRAAEDRLKNISATCFSLDGNNKLMWGLYGDGHKGVCLQFDNLATSRFKINPGMEGLVRYDQTEQVNYCADRVKAVARMFLSKDEDWHHEQEYRFLSLKGEGYYEFNPKFLTGVYLGFKVSKESERRLIGCAKDNGFDHIKFYRSTVIDKNVKYDLIGLEGK